MTIDGTDISGELDDGDTLNVEDFVVGAVARIAGLMHSIGDRQEEILRAMALNEHALAHATDELARLAAYVEEEEDA